MDAELWRRVEDLYHASLEVTPEQRSAFLKDKCGGNEELQREVESLLAHEERSGGFIETSAFEVAARLRDEIRELKSELRGMHAAGV